MWRPDITHFSLSILPRPFQHNIYFFYHYYFFTSRSLSFSLSLSLSLSLSKFVILRFRREISGLEGEGFLMMVPADPFQDSLWSAEGCFGFLCLIVEIFFKISPRILPGFFRDSSGLIYIPSPLPRFIRDSAGCPVRSSEHKRFPWLPSWL